MTVLVTGATGFVGSHLVRRLLTQYEPNDIVCLVKPSSAPKEVSATTALREAGVRFIEGDLESPTVSTAPAPRVDLVFHLAANIETTATDWELRVNDIGTGHLLSWLGPALHGGRLLYTSSIAVLDRDGPAQGPLNESSPCVPRTAYGRTKLRGEQVIRKGSASGAYHYTILRLATVYGRGAKVGGLFDRLFQLSARRSLLARLNWPGRTSIMHVDDVTAVLMRLSTCGEAADEVFCIANPDAPTVGVLAEQIGHFAPDSYAPVRLPDALWRLCRILAWSRPTQALGALIAPITLWRLTLMIDDGFWFDTQKLQSLGLPPTRELLEGLAEMLKYM